MAEPQQQQRYLRSPREMTSPLARRIPLPPPPPNNRANPDDTTRTPPSRKSAWSTFTNWLSTSFSSEDSDDGSADEERDTTDSSGTIVVMDSGTGECRHKGKGKGRVGMIGGTPATPPSSSSSRRQRRENKRTTNTNGFSPASGTSTSPSPVRHHSSNTHTSTTNANANNNSPLGSSVRPAFVRASTLRTIEEGDSPYGSYLSSSIPSLRHLAAIAGASSSSTAPAGGAGQGEASPVLVPVPVNPGKRSLMNGNGNGGGGGGGNGVRRSSADGSAMSVVVGMSMIKEVITDGDLQIKTGRSATAGGMRDGSVHDRKAKGARSSVMERSRSRSRSRSPNLPSLPLPHGQEPGEGRSGDGREPNGGSATLVNGETDDDTREAADDDPFYVPPSSAARRNGNGKLPPPLTYAEAVKAAQHPTMTTKTERAGDAEESTQPAAQVDGGSSSSSSKESGSRTEGYDRTPTGSSLRNSNNKSPCPASTAEQSQQQEDNEEEERAEETWKAWLIRFMRGPLFEAGWKFSALWIGFTVLLAGTIWLGLPRLDPEDKPALKLPRSFADLQALNGLFQKYKDRKPLGVMAVGCASYLYVQMFTLPGSMYISILFGAAYGIIIGLFLSCICEATGALLCYCLSAVIGPPLLTIEAYRTRLETWRTKIMGDKDKGEDVGWDGVFSFLVVLRIAPFPPHWIANFVAPHLGIHPLLFWSAVFIGIAPVSVIHTTIGSGLDHMTSAEDFHILSVRNVLGLIGVAVAVMIPSALKRFFKKDLSGLSEAEAALHNPDIQIQAASINGEAESTLTARSRGYQDSYYASDAITYQAQDSSTMPRSPTRYGSTTDSFYYGSARKGKGRAMDLEEALSVIENEEDHEVLAVVYEGDAEADSIIEEFASSALHQESGSEGESDDDDADDKTEDGKEYGYGSLHSLGRGSTHRGYGTIPHENAQEDEDALMTPRADQADGKQWWSFWK